MKEHKVKIELTEFEADLFIRYFRKHQNFWELVRRKVHPGSVTLHFDSSNEIRKKELHIIDIET